MNSLKRQAAKAERYAKLRDEMRAKLRIVLASKFVALDLQLADVDVQLSGLTEEISTKNLRSPKKKLNMAHAPSADTPSSRRRAKPPSGSPRSRSNPTGPRVAVNTIRSAARNSMPAQLRLTAEIAATVAQATSLRGELEANQAIVASAASDAASSAARSLARAAGRCLGVRIGY